jgi:hypothetical protein
VAVLARHELGDPEPVLSNGRRVHTGIEADVTADAGELAVAGGGVHGLVDVDALLLAIDVDVRVDLLAVHVDGAVHGLLPMAREALLVARGVQGRAGPPRVRRAGHAGQRREPDGERAEQHADERETAPAHSFTPCCSWHASHMPCG